MNRKLKIALISLGILVPAYLGFRLYKLKKALKQSKSKFESGGSGAKEILINEILIKDRQPITDANINKYMKYTLEELQYMVGGNSADVDEFDEGFSDYLEENY